MNEFRMSRTNGVLLAIMNVLVRHYQVGNFVIQTDSGQPARLGGGRKDYWAHGYIDTGRAVSCDFWLTSSERIGLPEARVSFGHCSGERKTLLQMSLQFMRFERRVAWVLEKYRYLLVEIILDV